MPLSDIPRPFCTRSAGILDETLRRMESSLPDQDAEPDQVRSGLNGGDPRLHATTRPVRSAKVLGCGRRWVGWGRSLFAVTSVDHSVLAWGEASSLEVGVAEPT